MFGLGSVYSSSPHTDLHLFLNEGRYVCADVYYNLEKVDFM